MTTPSNATSLKEKHAKLEAQIDEELKRVRPDDVAVRMLKRRKLLIKDKMHQLIARRYKQPTHMGAEASS
jgi:hypothetical protein